MPFGAAAMGGAKRRVFRSIGGVLPGEGLGRGSVTAEMHACHAFLLDFDAIRLFLRVCELVCVGPLMPLRGVKRCTCSNEISRPGRWVKESTQKTALSTSCSSILGHSSLAQS